MATEWWDDEPDECEMTEADYDDEEEHCCVHCGKPFEDFSDIGCRYCDRRSPDYGVL